MSSASRPCRRIASTPLNLPVAMSHARGFRGMLSRGHAVKPPQNASWRVYSARSRTTTYWRASCSPSQVPFSGGAKVLRNSLNWRARMQSALALCAMFAISGCAARYAQVPARLALAPYGRVALITFSSERANGTLSTLATQQFAEAVLASQTSFELLELSSVDSSVRHLPAGTDGTALAQAVGRDKKVPAVFVGQLTVSGVKPRGGLSAQGTVNLSAAVSAELTVRLVSTQSGGT